MDEYVITKHVAKHGKEAVIVVPAALRTEIPAGSLAQITIRIIKRPSEVAP